MKINIAILLSIFYIACNTTCLNEIIKEIYSPDEKYKAICFIRNCGATTDYSYHVSILKKKQVLPNKPGNVFICDSNHVEFTNFRQIKISWKSKNELIIDYPGSPGIFKKNKSYRNFLIIYR